MAATAENSKTVHFLMTPPQGQELTAKYIITLGRNCNEVCCAVLHVVLCRVVCACCGVCVLHAVCCVVLCLLACAVLCVLACAVLCVLAVLSCVALRVLVRADDGRGFLPYAYVIMCVW